jgi:hypothetical protein
MGIGGNPRFLLSRHADDVDGGAFQPFKEPKNVAARHPVHPLHAAPQQGLHPMRGDVQKAASGEPGRAIVRLIP